jgi:hypothetical protein
MYPDVAARHGPDDYAGAIVHWVLTGIPEGRAGCP